MRFLTFVRNRTWWTELTSSQVLKNTGFTQLYYQMHLLQFGYAWRALLHQTLQLCLWLKTENSFLIKILLYWCRILGEFIASRLCVVFVAVLICLLSLYASTSTVCMGGVPHMTPRPSLVYWACMVFVHLWLWLPISIDSPLNHNPVSHLTPFTLWYFIPMTSHLWGFNSLTEQFKIYEREHWFKLLRRFVPVEMDLATPRCRIRTSSLWICSHIKTY